MKPVGLLKIPQVLGAALAANVFIIIATQIKSLDEAPWHAFAVLCFAFLLNLKDFFDDMKAYEVADIEGFSLFPTVAFRVISYMALAWSASVVPKTQHAFFAIGLYFTTFVIWSLVSIYRRMKLKSNSVENQERMRRRKMWVVIYSTQALCCFLIWKYSDETLIFIGSFVAVALFVFDFIDSRSFTSSVNPTL